MTFNDNNATIGATIFSSRGSTIISQDNTNLFFNDLPARWCYNKCLPYTRQGDFVTVDNTGLAWCSNQNLLFCVSCRCYCKDLENILQTNRHNLVNISDNVVVLSSSFFVSKTARIISIIGHNNPTVICVNGGGLIFRMYLGDIRYNLTIKGITWIGCGEVTDTLVSEDGLVVSSVNIDGVLGISGFNKVTIQKCSFQYSVGQVISIADVDVVDINDCNFVRNTNAYRGYSTMIYFLSWSYIIVSFKNCYFSSNDGIKHVIYFDGTQVFSECDRMYNMQIYLIISSFYSNQGISIYLNKQQNLYISGEVSFENNVAEYGVGIYMSNHSTVTFGKNSNTKFINNSVHYNGATIFLNDHSNVLFLQSHLQVIELPVVLFTLRSTLI